MAGGVMSRQEFERRDAENRRRMAMQLFGRPDILPDIPEEVVGAGDFIQPGSNPHGFSGYPTWDRRRSVEERANQIMMENPGIASPEAAVEMAEREIPQYSRSEQRIVAMEDYYRSQGHPSPREAAIMEEEDAWRQRGRLIRDGNAAGRAAPARATRSAPESRTDGASLPLPTDSDVEFGSTVGMPPVEKGVDPKRVAEVAAPMVAAGIPREEAWQRAQLQLMRGTAPQPPRPAADPWAGYETFEGADRDKVAALADHFVRTRGMNSDQAWEAAQVEASRDTIRGGTIPYAEADSRLRGGPGIVRDPNMTVPGRNDETGTPTSVARKMSDKEAYDYNYRAPGGAKGGRATQGGYELSQRDKDMMERGLVPVQTPNGVRYMPMAGYSRNEAGRPGVPGYREDLVERGYEGQKVKDVQGMDATVYVRTPEGAERAERTRLVPLGGMQGGSPTAHNQRIKDLAERAGVSIERARQIVAETVKESTDDDDPNNDIVMGSNASYQRLRDMGTSRYQADKLERVKESRRQAMLAGGQPTGGPNGTRARDAAIGMLPPDWQAQVLANRASGGQIAGATPFDVEGQRLANSRKLDIARELAGDKNAGDGPPAAAVAAAEKELPVAAHADLERKRNGGRLPAQSHAGQRTLKEIDDTVIGTFATDSEIETAVEAAVDAGIDEGEARAYFNRRRRDLLTWATPPGGRQGPPDVPRGGQEPPQHRGGGRREF